MTCPRCFAPDDAECDHSAEITFTTYSDDCASILDRNNIDESDLWGHWWPLIVDGEHVGDVMVDHGYGFGSGWSFALRPAEGHTLEVDDDPALLPPEEDHDS